MKKLALTVMALLLPALFGLSQLSPLPGGAQLHAGACGLVDQGVWDELAGNSDARVIVSLKLPEGAPDPTPQQMQTNTTTRQAAVLAAMSPTEFTVEYQYNALPGLAGSITAAGASALDCQPDVVSVDFDFGFTLALGESVPLIGADTTRIAGVDGTGVQVAVIDTGLDAEHPDLSDNLKGGICLMPPGFCSVFPAFPADELPGGGHGTHVAGIITSAGVVAPVGVAPNVDIYAYKVFDAATSGSWGPFIDALNDIYWNHPGQFKLINMSLSGGLFDNVQDCEGAINVVTTAFRLIRPQGTLPVAAAGNSANKSALGLPACLPTVLSVGATYDADTGERVYGGQCIDATSAADEAVCYSNSSDFLDVVAPGNLTVSALPLDAVNNPCSFEPIETVGVGPCHGTSMAAPHAVAVAALLWSIMPSLTPDEVTAILKRTGVPVTDDLNDSDPFNDRTKPRVDAQAAVLDDDFDQDGCTNGQEIGDDEAAGGQRDPASHWDFMDQWIAGAKDGSIVIGDLGAVVARFGSGTGLAPTKEDALAEALTPPPDTTSYHASADRGGAVPGMNPWNLLPPDGLIVIGDIGAVVAQFGHSC